MNWSRSMPSGAEAAADWGSLKSAETYVGFELTENFASPGGARLNKSASMLPRAVEAQSLGPIG